MKKQLLLGAFVLSSLFTMNAQTIIWSDDFDDTDVADWTLVDSDGDGSNWNAVQIQDADEQPVGTPLLRSASWVGPDTALTPDNWAITPAIDLTGLSMGDAVSLNWSVMAADADWDVENYTVYVGTVNTVADLSTSSVTYNEPTLDGVNTLTPRSLDISSFAGETIYVGFRHHDSTNQFTMEIDDVSVTTDVANIEERFASEFSVYPNPANNVVTITNALGTTITGATVTDINGRTVKSVVFNGVAEAQVNIADLAVGVYVLNIESSKGTATKKIVKN